MEEPGVTAATLAAWLGRTGRYFTVAKALQRMRGPEGWHSPLVRRTCTECGAPLASPPAPRRTVHPWCEAARAACFQRQYRREGRARKSTPYVAAWRQRHPERERELREQDKARRRAQWPALPQERRAELARQRCRPHRAAATVVLGAQDT